MKTNKTKLQEYDLIIVPGLKLGPNWGMRKDLRARLRVAAEIYRHHPGTRVVVSGRWSIWYDWLGIRPPVTECSLMKTFLLGQGVAKKDIVMESRSKDTPGNVYYLKRYVRTKPQYKKLVVVCAAQHEKRLRFLFYKFFGASYQIDFIPVASPRFDSETTANEARCLAEQEQLLFNVRPGHEDDFKHKFYKSAYYTRQVNAARANAAVFLAQ